jgi:ankyrin repeat protein
MGSSLFLLALCCGLALALVPLPVALAARRPGDSEQQQGVAHARLIQAAGRGRGTTVTALLKAGADPDAQNQDGMTPLMAASLGGHSETVATLVASGANVDATDAHGSTALMFAMFAENEGHVEAVGALLAAGGASLVVCCVGVSVSLFCLFGQSFRQPGCCGWTTANVNAQDKDGYTVLMGAAREGHKKLAAMLTTAGADVDLQDKQVRKSHVFLRHVLTNAISRQARDTHQNETTQTACCLMQGYTALIIASLQGHTETVEVRKRSFLAIVLYIIVLCDNFTKTGSGHT